MHQGSSGCKHSCHAPFQSLPIGPSQENLGAMQQRLQQMQAEMARLKALQAKLEAKQAGGCRRVRMIARGWWPNIFDLACRLIP